MSDQEEYRFPDEGDTSSGDTAPGFSDDKGGEPEEWTDEKKLRKALEKAERKKGSSTRILLLVLLVMILAGAVVYFYMGVPQLESPSSPPETAKKQPIAVPPPTGNEKTAVNAVEQEPADETEAETEPEPEPEIVTESDPVVDEPETSGDQMISTEEKAPEVAAPDVSASQETGISGAYAVRSGAFLFKDHLAGAMDKLVRMGYEPQTEEGRKQVAMTRLKLGVFVPEEAEERMAELSRKAPGVFSLPSGDKVAVYAGSYYTLDKARRLADRLYKQGIRLEEETVELEVPLYLLSFGGFAERDDALDAAARARAAGLDAYVVKSN